MNHMIHTHEKIERPHRCCKHSSMQSYHFWHEIRESKTKQNENMYIQTVTCGFMHCACDQQENAGAASAFMDTYIVHTNK